MVWGASAFPQVVAVLILLPLDLLIVGTSTYTTGTLSDPLATAWSAFSIAIGMSVAVWSVFLFIRGIQVASGLGFWRSAAAAGVALLCFATLVAAVTVAGSLSTEVTSCPTPRG